jgi:hypothetical protein
MGILPICQRYDVRSLLKSDMWHFNSNGTWTLAVRDNWSSDTGSLESWGIRICPLSPGKPWLNSISFTESLSQILSFQEYKHAILKSQKMVSMYVTLLSRLCWFIPNQFCLIPCGYFCYSIPTKISLVASFFWNAVQSNSRMCQHKVTSSFENNSNNKYSCSSGVNIYFNLNDNVQNITITALNDIVNSVYIESDTAGMISGFVSYDDAGSFASPS